MTITISLDSDLLLKIILLLFMVNGSIKITAGLMGAEKSKTYDWVDVLDGLVAIIIVLVVVTF